MTTPAPRPAKQPQRPQQRGTGSPRVSVCGGCGGTHAPAEGGPAPLGWLSISVSIPAEISRRPGKRHQFIGQYCSVRCMVADAARLAGAEKSARTLYIPDLPEHPRREAAESIAGLMRAPGGRR